MKSPCKYCLKPIYTPGMPAHVSFKHRGYALREMCRSPLMLWFHLYHYGYLLTEDRKMLPAPNPLTIYSTRPLGKMAAPIPQLRRPKGYQPPHNYARPADILAGQRPSFVWQK